MKKKLPVGIQTFRDIRDPKENYVYIDKTDIALSLIQNGRYYFLSRPRRFGKSLFLDTLSEIFQGNKGLFEGLSIYDQWDWSQQSPVVHISFASGEYNNRQDVLANINILLHKSSQAYNVEVEDIYKTQAGKYLQALVHALYVKYGTKVAILIDEYDKPILDNIHKEDKTAATEARDVLRGFYSAIKDSDEYLRFVFITGVSKFSKLNLFSGLNNMEDITLRHDCATITGYTHADILQHFDDYLAGADMEEVRRWYNGYNYFGEPIYNPFDILLFLSSGCEFSNYWWETGNPSFLIELLRKKPYFLPDVENIEVTEETLNALDVETIDLVALLWQTGYLTFHSKRKLVGRTIYRLKIPNLEIQISLNQLFVNTLTEIGHGMLKQQNSSAQSLLDGDLSSLRSSLIGLFAAIPYSNYTSSPISRYEGYYASVVFTFLASLGFDVTAEDTTNLGRIDMTLRAEHAVYIFEFKVDMPAESAIHQIRTKKYYEKYLSECKPVYLIGIQFSSAERNITGFEWEQFERNE